MEPDTLRAHVKEIEQRLFNLRDELTPRCGYWVPLSVTAHLHAAAVEMRNVVILLDRARAGMVQSSDPPKPVPPKALECPTGVEESVWANLPREKQEAIWKLVTLARREQAKPS